MNIRTKIRATSTIHNAMVYVSMLFLIITSWVAFRWWGLGVVALLQSIVFFNGMWLSSLHSEFIEAEQARVKAELETIFGAIAEQERKWNPPSQLH